MSQNEFDGTVPLWVKKLTIDDIQKIYEAVTKGEVQNLIINGAVGFNPTAVADGGTLPVTAIKEYLFVGAGIFNKPGGGTIVTTENLNVLASNGAEWSLSLAIAINLSSVFTKEQTQEIYGYENETGIYLIKDEDDNIAFGITKDGLIKFSHLHPLTLNRLKNDLDIQINNKIYNKKISILGDSISTDDGGGNAGLAYPNQYWGRLQNLQNCEIFRNAIGGTTIANSGTGNPMNTPARWQSLDTNFNPDIIFLFGGINDFLQDVPLGVKTDTTVTTFYGALDYLYKSIMTKYPNTRFYHITPAHTTYFTVGSSIPEFNGQNYLSDFIDAILVVCRRYGVTPIDVNRDSGITCFNIATLSGDNIHFKAEGHEMVYNLIISTLENTL